MREEEARAELKGVPDRWRVYRVANGPLSWVVRESCRDQSAAPPIVVASKSGAKKSGLHPTAVRQSRIHPR
jgi:hypothetical protein